MADPKSIRKRIRTRKKRVSGNCLKCGVWRYGLHHDHIVPKWKGGADTSDNIQHLCGNRHEDKTREEQTGYNIRESIRRGIPVPGTPTRNRQKFKVTHRRSGTCPCGIFRITLHRDHVIPKWQGGADDPENIQLLCANCHEDKTLEENKLRGGPLSPAYGKKLTPETKAKIGAANRGRIGHSKGQPLSEETKRKISKARLGQPGTRGFTGGKHSTETRQQMSESRRGAGNGMYGKHPTQDTKNKISASLIGRPSPKKGKPGHIATEVTRHKMSMASKGRPKTPEHKLHISEGRTRWAAKRRGQV